MAGRTWLAGLGGAALGLLAGVWVARTGPAPAPPAASSRAGGSVADSAPAPTLLEENLEEELREERSSRQALEARVEALQKALAEAQSGTEAAAKPAGGAGADGPGSPPAGGFRVAELQSLGVSAEEAERLRKRYEALELDRVYLRNQARRERWLGRPRYQRELHALDQQALADLGEQAYDEMLYAAGRNNRVIVSHLLANSPAQAAGLQPGDVLMRYAGQRVFDARTILSLTAQGKPGATTEVRVDRGGQDVRLFVPRGPLGVQLRLARRPPDTSP